MRKGAGLTSDLGARPSACGGLPGRPALFRAIHPAPAVLGVRFWVAFLYGWAAGRRGRPPQAAGLPPKF
ncbi:MAG: hypothetical protein ABSH56_14020, partial [Bryobacteraceae bacterium]